MAGRLSRGEIWWLDRPRPDKRRPVLILSRPALLEVLDTVTVASITRTRRGARTEVDLGEEHGLRAPSCVNLCNIFTVRQRELRQFVGSMSEREMLAVCEALAISVACDLP